MPKITFISPGFYTSVQDMGRFGYAIYGVPQSGAMDSLAARKANLLVDNPEDSAVLEITMTGPKIRFESACIFTVCGAEFDLKYDGRSIGNDKAYGTKAGALLEFGGLKKGFRAYIAFKGGFNVPQVLGSRSMYGGITAISRIKKGDMLELRDGFEKKHATLSKVRFRENGNCDSTLEVLPGPEYELLKKAQQSQIATGAFTVLPSGNRMAIAFYEKIPNELGNILTAPVLPGTVQLTPEGTLIALMRDCQVSGGYPRVLQLTETGINRLSQIAPGKSALFKFGGI